MNKIEAIPEAGGCCSRTHSPVELRTKLVFPHLVERWGVEARARVLPLVGDEGRCPHTRWRLHPTNLDDIYSICKVCNSTINADMGVMLTLVCLSKSSGESIAGGEGNAGEEKGRRRKCGRGEGEYLEVSAKWTCSWSIHYLIGWNNILLQDANTLWHSTDHVNWWTDFSWKFYTNHSVNVF